MITLLGLAFFLLCTSVSNFVLSDLASLILSQTKGPGDEENTYFRDRPKQAKTRPRQKWVLMFMSASAKHELDGIRKNVTMLPECFNSFGRYRNISLLETNC